MCSTAGSLPYSSIGGAAIAEEPAVAEAIATARIQTFRIAPPPRKSI
jgi:hypothetical protein